MKKLLMVGLVLWSVVLWSSSPAAEGYASKSASGTTNAAAIFPGGPPLRVTDYDVTADNATNTLVFQVGTVGATVKKAAVGTNTSVTFGKTTLTTNDVVILQTAADAVTNKTVTIVATTTNQIMTLANPIGTNLAVGDVLRKKLTTAYSLYAPSLAAATAFFISSTNGLIANDLVIAELPDVVSTNVVSAITSVTNKLVTLRTPVLTALAAANIVYTRSTNYAVLNANAAASATSLFFATTNGFSGGDNVVIQSGGNLQVVQINTIAGTNVTLITGLAFACSTNDRMNLLGLSYSVRLPVSEGDRSLITSSPSSLAAGDVIICVPTTGSTFPAVVDAVSGTNVNTLTFTHAFPWALPDAAKFYKLTNNYQLVFSAALTDSDLILNNATNLAAGDALILSPASGGAFRNVLVLAGTDYATTAVTFSAAIGNALAVGDNAFLLSNQASIPVGAATLRQTGNALFSVDRGRPLRVIVTGAAACSVNNVTVKYD